MLLGNQLLKAARLWAHRRTAEQEAAAHFSTLADELRALGEGDRIVGAARAAADDERRHADLCRAIVHRLAPDIAFPTAPNPAALGPADLTRADRALYASVALSCVTETLSTALLIEMRPHITDTLVRDVVTEILRDEVGHARIGWAHLAAESARRDVEWLAPHIPGMLRAAIPEEGTATTGEGAADLGILPRSEVLRVTRTVSREVLLPGLARFGIAVDPTQFEAR